VCNLLARKDVYFTPRFLTNRLARGVSRECIQEKLQGTCFFSSMLSSGGARVVWDHGDGCKVSLFLVFFFPCCCVWAGEERENRVHRQKRGRRAGSGGDAVYIASYTNSLLLQASLLVDDGFFWPSA
jgi:hypothetical protein